MQQTQARPLWQVNVQIKDTESIIYLSKYYLTLA